MNQFPDKAESWTPNVTPPSVPEPSFSLWQKYENGTDKSTKLDLCCSQNDQRIAKPAEFVIVFSHVNKISRFIFTNDQKNTLPFTIATLKTESAHCGPLKNQRELQQKDI